jgi:hypothetical protein
MFRLLKTLLAVGLLTATAIAPALAKGEVTVEHKNGDTNTYSGVEISNAPNVLYLKSQDSDTTLMITKNECTKEGELLVCNKARAGVDTHGVIEELDVAQIVLFINPTQTPQPIKGSKVTMSPNTVLLEMSTKKGSYITALGKIDSSTRPAGADK